MKRDSDRSSSADRQLSKRDRKAGRKRARVSFVKRSPFRASNNFLLTPVKLSEDNEKKIIYDGHPRILARRFELK